jgi:Fe-S-cluster containining protein
MFLKKNEDTSFEYTALNVQVFDITEQVCLRCAKCCEQTVSVSLDDRFYEYLLFREEKITRDPRDPNLGILSLGHCKYLVFENGLKRCSVYEHRPQMCRDFNCVAWAKCQNLDEKDPTIAYVLDILNSL